MRRPRKALSEKETEARLRLLVAAKRVDKRIGDMREKADDINSVLGSVSPTRNPHKVAVLALVAGAVIGYYPALRSSAFSALEKGARIYLKRSF